MSACDDLAHDRAVGRHGAPRADYRHRKSRPQNDQIKRRQFRFFMPNHLWRATASLFNRRGDVAIQLEPGKTITAAFINLTLFLSYNLQSQD